MTVPTSTLAANVTAPRLGSLFRAEFQRARARRSLLWLTVLALAALVFVSTIMWIGTGHVTQAELDTAVDQYVAEQQRYYDQCIADPAITQADRLAGACGQPATADDLGNAYWYLPKPPFAQSEMEGLLALAGGIGVLVCLMLAATTGGADWGARTMGLLLSWEPRRTRVLLVRLVVTVGIAVAVEALLLGLALALGSIIGAFHYLDPALAATIGDSVHQPIDLAESGGLAARWIPLAALAAAGSFAVAMLTRSTGWAIGASIGFVAVVESVVQGVWLWGSQWLIQTNVVAWLEDGTIKQVDRRTAGSGADFMSEGTVPPGSVLISDTRALVTLTCLVVTLSLVSWLAFTRRDVE